MAASRRAHAATARACYVACEEEPQCFQFVFKAPLPTAPVGSPAARPRCWLKPNSSAEAVYIGDAGGQRAVWSGRVERKGEHTHQWNSARPAQLLPDIKNIARGVAFQVRQTNHVRAVPHPMITMPHSSQSMHNHKFSADRLASRFEDDLQQRALKQTRIASRLGLTLRQWRHQEMQRLGVSMKDIKDGTPYKDGVFIDK